MSLLDEVVVAILRAVEGVAMDVELIRPPAANRQRIWAARVRELRMRFQKA